MKAVIVADYEGVCGVRAFYDGPGCRIIEVEPGAKRQMLREINACVDGLRSAGVDEILVWDNHPDPEGYNFSVYDMRPGVNLAVSRDYAGPVPKMDASFDCAIHLGAFARNHTRNAFMAQTIDGKIYDSLKLNGVEIGNIGMNILAASYFNVPTILVAGDDKACAEAREFIGSQIETVETKKGISRFKSMNRSQPEVCAELAAKAEKAVRGLAEFKVKKIEGPFKLEIKVISPNYIDQWTHMGYEPLDDCSIVLESPDFIDLLAQLYGWSPGAHFKRYGFAPATNDFFTIPSFD